MTAFGICQFFGGDTVIRIKNGRYSVFQRPNGDGKIQFLIGNTVEPLKTNTLRDEQKCPSYRGVRLIEVIFNRNRPLGHLKVSVLERCPSYGMSVLRGFTVEAETSSIREDLVGQFLHSRFWTELIRILHYNHLCDTLLSKFTLR